MKQPPDNSILDLAAQLQKFADERDWVQFHTPKNLAMALSVEAAELAEPFTWLRPEDSDSLDPKQLAAVKQELGDVLIYTIMLASRLGIDPLEAAYEKLKINRAKYPADQVRGSPKKYTEY